MCEEWVAGVGGVYTCLRLLHPSCIMTLADTNAVSPANVSVHGLIPANRLEVPKSEIFRTPL